jgi:hypothetical protein
LISWEDKVGNPDSMGSREKDLWSEIEPLLDDSLDELKANGRIETIYTSGETGNLISALQKLDEFSKANNVPDFLSVSDFHV